MADLTDYISSIAIDEQSPDLVICLLAEDNGNSVVNEENKTDSCRICDRRIQYHPDNGNKYYVCVECLFNVCSNAGVTIDLTLSRSQLHYLRKRR